jgi:predicted nucleotidyltransferase
MGEVVRERIETTLDGIERDEGVGVLYACESGSRAWGFASTDSDYDVRFIYARPRDAYLLVDAPRDVIERPIVDDLDVNGWDIFKALRLLRKSNPPLLEWLFSPIVYRETSPAVAELRAVAREHFSGMAMFYHYLHLVTGNYRDYIQGKPELVLKKYLYVLRPLTAMLFLEQRQTIPPTNFQETLAHVAVADDVRARIGWLVQQKASGTELGRGTPDPTLNAFIEEQIGRIAAPQRAAPQRAAPQDPAYTARLDAILARVLSA